MEEARFKAMGSDVHAIVVGGPNGLARRARERIDELERRWSRFRPDSEISRLNANAGRGIEVSDDTVELISLAIEAWRLTGATFDPTVLGAVVRSGYTASFEKLPPNAAPTPSDLVVACTDIEIDGNTVRLPARSGFDPGGIGKGLAADLVAAELLSAGADGVCINMGGDLRCLGTPPDGAGWTVTIEHPWSSTLIASVGIADGAVATSTTLRRRWTVAGAERHHLIDPRTGEPADTDLNLVTVIAGTAWAAEVVAKAVLVRGSLHPFDLVEGTGAYALIVDDGGAITVSDGFDAFLRYGWIADGVERCA